jgi:hypothetical protein
MQNFKTLRQPLLGDLAEGWIEREREKREREIMPSLMVTSPSAQRRSDQKKKNSASADGGPRSRVCARETLRSAPHRH